MLRLKKPEDDGLNILLRISNRMLGAYNQPPLYASEPASNPRHGQSRLGATEAEDFTNCFHISLAWSLTEPLPVEWQRVSEIYMEEMNSLKISFSSVKAKLGNVVHSLNLE